MKLLAGNEIAYRNRHEAIWPELKEILHAAGISNYSIFLDTETSTLFASLEATDESFITELPLQPVMQEWWKFMKDIMETNNDGSPVSISLTEVFHLP